MGKIFSRGDAWLDPEYIVNITTNVMGKNTLSALTNNREGRNGHALRALFYKRVEEKVREMSDETLGRICAYGGPKGLHVGPPCQVSFLNMTGYADVLDFLNFGIAGKDGRGILETFATLTILCIARDIVMQEKWQADFIRELADEEEYDRGMREYLHHGGRHVGR